MTAIPVVEVPQTDPSARLYISRGALIVAIGEHNLLSARILPVTHRYVLALIEPQAVIVESSSRRPARRLRAVDERAFQPRHEHVAQLFPMPSPRAGDPAEYLALADVLQRHLDAGLDTLTAPGDVLSVRNHDFELLLDPEGTPVLSHLGHTADPSKGPTQ